MKSRFKTLVFNRNSLSAALEGDHLVIRDHAVAGSPPQRVPLVDVARVIVVGTPAISFNVLAKLMDKRIPCSFLTAGVRWRGRLDGDHGFHAGRRIRQYETVSDSDFCLRMGKWMIEGKLRNSRRTLQRLAANRKIDLTGDGSWRNFGGCLGMVPKCGSIDELRGVEGAAAANYFKLLARFFPREFPFEGRSRRPPPDPANALLSFAYTLLEGEFSAMVRAHGLDVAAGYFHRGKDRSPSLALDLMEPFRSYFADRMVLDLVNHHRIDPVRHFEHDAVNGGVYLNDMGRSIVFRAADEAFDRCCMTRCGRLSLRQLIDRAVCDFISVLEEHAEPKYILAS